VSDPPACFYFDLSSPLAYLAAERILQELPGPAAWQPVLASQMPAADRFDAFGCRDEEDIFRAELARSAQALHLQPLRWPDPFPFESALAMRVATYARSIGRVVPFAQAAFRQAFAGGRNLQEPDNVLIAAAACEMHPTAVLRAAELRSVAAQLATATATAVRTGVRDVPAVVLQSTKPGLPDRVFSGERMLEEAAAHMSPHAPTGASPRTGAGAPTGGGAPTGARAPTGASPDTGAGADTRASAAAGEG
jgi:2-hydroxychromene-2-carboxylate isomerase